VLAVEGLGKRYGGRWVFRRITLEVRPGQRLVVLGSNGAGKSTLLKVVAGLVPASEGAVRLPEGDPRRVLGMAALEMALYPQLSAMEHLEFAAAMRGCEGRGEELLAQVRLLEARDRPAAQLSTGMKSRLKLALAIQPRPALLLLDEPGAAMDEAGRELLDELIAEQSERGAVVVATNDPAERRWATHELELAG
jgi:heme exporter protein A